MLADQLPQGAQSWLALGTDHGWTNEAHLLACVADILNDANWQRAGDQSASRPEPITRPSGATKAAESQDRMLARAQRFRERTTKTEEPNAD